MRWKCHALWGLTTGWEPTLTPLRVVFTGERRKGMAGEKRQHLRTQICTALPVPYCREARWRAGAGVERRKDKQQEAREEGGENRKSCRYES